MVTQLQNNVYKIMHQQQNSSAMRQCTAELYRLVNKSRKHCGRGQAENEELLWGWGQNLHDADARPRPNAKVWN